MTQLTSHSLVSGHEDRATLWRIIQEIQIAMLTTLADDGSLRSRPMSTQLIDADLAQVWFFISTDSHTLVEIYHDREICLAYASPEHHRYASASGRAFIVRDRAKANELWTPDAEAWFSQGVNDPHLALLCVEVDSAQYWDSPAGNVVHLDGLADLRLARRAAD